MDPGKQRALMSMIAHSVLKIDFPSRGAVSPFKINLDVMEANPAVRDPLLSAMMSEALHGALPEAIAATPFGSRALACMLADRLNLPYILPVTATAADRSPILLYGFAPPGARIMLVQDVTVASEPLERMIGALHASGYIVQRILVAVDCDIRGTVTAALRRVCPKADYRSLFSAAEILIELRDNPDLKLIVEPMSVTRAYDHFFPSVIFSEK